MALEPSGDSASGGTPAAESGVFESSLPPRVPAGFAEPNALFRTKVDLPAELRALRGHVDTAVLRWAAARAEAVGLGADIIIRRSGVIHPDIMLEAYAADLGVPIDLLQDSATTELDAETILASGLLPAATRDGKRPTIAACGENLKALYEQAATNPASVRPAAITSPERLRAFVERSGARELANDAAFGLLHKYPALSANAKYFASYRTTALAVVVAAAASFYLAPKLAWLAIELTLAAIFLSWAALRLFACCLRERRSERQQISERDLPIYTILIPLHREAKVVFELVQAISALNYPREKLDVKLILEPDDADTIAAVRAIRLEPCFEVMIAPDSGPRTKPKALRAALPFARGEFTVVYDAEDRPDPDQLRDAYARFLCGDARLACVQAKLAIDNEKSNFLTSHFRAEYSGLFDALLPALARLHLPVPLGGTSNHFRTDILREVGGWDPHNVTEDADLGIRLARFGYTTDVINSTTWEEAPARFEAWLPQRTRWMKGFLQTYFVHMRRPLQLLRELGWRSFFAFQLLIGGSVLAALVHPVFALWLILDAAFGSLLLPADTMAQALRKSLAVITLMSGYVASGLLAFVGMRRRGLLFSARVILTIPLYWLLLSAAAWRAAQKLVTAPHQWEKTEHGVVARARIKPD